MIPNPRRRGRTNIAPTADSEKPEPLHPDTRIIDTASKTVIRLSNEGLSFDEAMKVFHVADNVGMRHIEACVLCLDALKVSLDMTNPTPPQSER